MDNLKKVISWLSLYALASLWFLTAGAYAFFAVVNEDTIKGTLQKHDAYSKIVPAAVDSTKFAAKTPEQSQLPLDEPWVQDAANKAFPPDTIRTHVETVVASIFAWLRGETDKPAFEIDLTENKNALGQEIGGHVATRLAGLPLCGRGDIPDPDNINYFEIQCRPPGVNPAAVGSNIEEEVVLNEGFLENPVISSDNLVLPDNTQASINGFDELKKFYENKNMLLFGLPLMTVLAVALGIWLAGDRIMALKRLSRSLFLAGFGLLVFAVIFFVISNIVTNAAPEDEVLTRELISPVFRDLARKAQSIYIGFGALALALSVATVFVRKKLQSRLT
jgi:hypothetical protein